MKSNSIWKLLFIVLVLAFSIMALYPPTGQDLLQEFERNEQTIKKLETDLRDAREASKKLDARIHQMDIQVEAEPDPRQEALLRLRPFFVEVGDALLRTKKQKIEGQIQKKVGEIKKVLGS